MAAAAKLEEASLVPVLAPLLETEAEELRPRILEALAALGETGPVKALIIDPRTRRVRILLDGTREAR